MDAFPQERVEDRALPRARFEHAARGGASGTSWTGLQPKGERFTMNLRRLSKNSVGPAGHWIHVSSPDLWWRLAASLHGRPDSPFVFACKMPGHCPRSAVDAEGARRVRDDIVVLHHEQRERVRPPFGFPPRPAPDSERSFEPPFSPSVRWWSTNILSRPRVRGTEHMRPSCVRKGGTGLWLPLRSAIFCNRNWQPRVHRRRLAGSLAKRPSCRS